MNGRRTYFGFPADLPRRFTDIEAEAMEVRRFLELPDTERVRGPEIFEQIHERRRVQAGRTVTFETGVDELPPGVEAQARFERERSVVAVTLSSGTYEDLIRNQPRALFSLCHELGHALMHVRELMRLSLIPHTEASLFRQNLPQPPAYLDAEWQANAFAAALIMPAVGLDVLDRNHGLTVYQIQRSFGASRAAAAKRLRTFNERRRQLVAAGGSIRQSVGRKGESRRRQPAAL